MRTASNEYWNTSLPKDHDALKALDAFCKEWGGLTRAEATRRLLIEWEKIRSGKEVSAWGSNAATRLAGSTSSEGSRRATGAIQKTPLSHAVAKAASQVLDD